VFRVPESKRLILPKGHDYYTDERDGNNGAFNLIYETESKRKIKLFVIASDGYSWEHVSVTVKNKKRCPTWSEMCFIKSLFWDDYDMVIQYHPPKSEYISYHDYCLHMWRPMNQTIPAPDHMMIAPKGIKPL